MTDHTPLALCEDRWLRVEKHLNESQAHRDRLRDCEMKLEIIQKQVLRNAIIGGIIGALIGSGSPQVITALIQLITKTGV